jgi:hypothetical protein
MDVKPRARRGGLIPPGRLPHSPSLSSSLSRKIRPSEEKVSGIEIKKELEVLAAIAPKNTTVEIQRSLAECIVDGTMLPGTSSESLELRRKAVKLHLLRKLSLESSEKSREAR